MAEGNVPKLLSTADGFLSDFKISDDDVSTYKQLLSTEGIPKALSFMVDKLSSQFDDYSKAELLAWADRPEEAIKLLFPLVKSKKLPTIKFATEPAFEKLHNHPKFQQLIQMMGLQEYN